MPHLIDPENGRSPEVRLRMASLAEMITICLREADALALDMTGIHLNDALESLKDGSVEGERDPL